MKDVVAVGELYHHCLPFGHISVIASLQAFTVSSYQGP